jgi:hypothetical protein
MDSEDKTQKVAEEVTQVIDAQDTGIKVEAKAEAGASENTAAPTTPLAPAPTPQPATSVASPPADNLAPAAPDGAQPAGLPTDSKPAETKESTSNPKVILLIAGGALLFLAGIVAALIGYIIPGIMVIVVAALLILLGVFLPIR